MKKVLPGLLEGGNGGFRNSGPFGVDGKSIGVYEILLSLMNPAVADTTTLAGLGDSDQAGIQIAGGLPYFFDPASTVNDALGLFYVRPGNITSGNPGRWRLLSRSGVLLLPFSSATADGVTVFTVPVGSGLRLLLATRTYYEIDVAFAGGTSSKVGFKSSNALYNTAGDIQGGASGDTAGGGGTGVLLGTAGAKFASGAPVVLVDGDTIVFNRMTSAFTSGSGKLRVPFVCA